MAITDPAATGATASINPTDVSNGYYPQLQKVGPNDPQFLAVIAWLVSKGAPAQTDLYATPALSPSGPGHSMPAQIRFTAPNGAQLSLDAALVFNFPHVALVELKQYFGFGNPNILEFYPGMPAPAPVVNSPIGAPWPEQGANCFRPADTDRSDYGAVYTDATGRYQKVQRAWAFFAYGVWVRSDS